MILLKKKHCIKDFSEKASLISVFCLIAQADFFPLVLSINKLKTNLKNESAIRQNTLIINV